MAGFRNIANLCICFKIRSIKRLNLCSANVASFVGFITLIIQLGSLHLIPESPSHPGHDDVEELGDMLYYGRTKLGVHYADYARSAVYKLALKPSIDDVAACDESSYKLHNIGGLPIPRVGLFQTLGDTNVHSVGAYLDDRLPHRPLLRILAVGLHPGPSDKIYCNYKCNVTSAAFCSTEAHGLILLAGNHTDYAEGENSMF